MCEVVSKNIAFFLKTHCFPKKTLFSKKKHCFPTCAIFYPIVLKRKIITGLDESVNKTETQLMCSSLALFYLLCYNGIYEYMQALIYSHFCNTFIVQADSLEINWTNGSVRVHFKYDLFDKISFFV